MTKRQDGLNAVNMKVDPHVAIKIIDDPAELRAIDVPSNHVFAIRIEGANGTVILTENLAAMLHGVIEGTWARLKGENLR